MKARDVQWTSIPEGEHNEEAVIYQGCILRVFGRDGSFGYYVNEDFGPGYDTIEEAKESAIRDADEYARDRKECIQ